MQKKKMTDHLVLYSYAATAEMAAEEIVEGGRRKALLWKRYLRRQVVLYLNDLMKTADVNKKTNKQCIIQWRARMRSERTFRIFGTGRFLLKEILIQDHEHSQDFPSLLPLTSRTWGSVHIPDHTSLGPFLQE